MTKNNPKITVIMSSYNRKDYIKEAIESILNQTYQDFEFIIIDDCSKKETQDVIEQYAKNDERIIFYLCPAKEKLNLHFTQYLKNYLIYEIS